MPYFLHSGSIVSSSIREKEIRNVGFRQEIKGKGGVEGIETIIVRFCLFLGEEPAVKKTYEELRPLMDTRNR